MRKTIGLTYDLKTDYVLSTCEPADANAEFDHPDTIGVIESAIERFGYNVRRIGNVHSLLKYLKSKEKKVDIVFNVAEGRFGRNRESQVPIILEMMGIPFVGSDGLTLGLTLDKVMTKKILLTEGIPTPRFAQVESPQQLNGMALNYPLIVKPRCEGSSKGLNDNSVVGSYKSLKKQVRWVIETYKQPAIIEEFICGREFTVAILGNSSPRALPLVQIRIDGSLDLGKLFYTFSRIHSDTLDYVCPAPVSKKLSARIAEVALETYKALECRDFARVDVRVDKHAQPYVLEINPLPSLSTEDVFAVIAKYKKMSYDRMLVNILEEGLKRYGMPIN